MAYWLAQLCINPQHEASSYTTSWFIDDVLQHIIALLTAKGKGEYAKMLTSISVECLSSRSIRLKTMLMNLLHSLQ